MEDREGPFSLSVKSERERAVGACLFSKKVFRFEIARFVSIGWRRGKLILLSYCAIFGNSL